jgi:deoxyhypusine synthase
MAYMDLIDSINKELASNGIENIYDLLIKNKGYEDVLEIIRNNADTYKSLSESDKQTFQNYIKYLHIQKKMLLN